MNAADESLGNVLLVGLGAVAIQVALDLRRHGAGRLGALNHPGRRSQRIAEALARGACLQLEGQGQHRWLSGNAALDVFHQDPAELRDDWQTLVLCVPADSYLDVVRGLPWERLGGVRTLLLVSAFIGANLLVRSALPAGCQATVLSLSSYYAATKVIDETQPLRALTKAVKRRVYLGSSRPDCPARETWRRVLAGSGVEVVPLATPEAAEGRNVTTYVHSPFFLGEFALARILSEQGPPGFMYKLYPEGPITPGAIGAMRRLWCELSELLRRMGAEPLNLLRSLNDDNYPCTRRCCRARPSTASPRLAPSARNTCCSCATRRCWSIRSLRPTSRVATSTFPPCRSAASVATRMDSGGSRGCRWRTTASWR